MKARNGEPDRVGEITAEEKKRIKERAIASVKSHLGPKGIAELAKILGLEAGSLDGFLSSKVEAAVHDLRHATLANGAPPRGATVPLAPAPAA
jgi:hypothetical protein